MSHSDIDNSQDYLNGDLSTNHNKSNKENGKRQQSDSSSLFTKLIDEDEQLQGVLIELLSEYIRVYSFLFRIDPFLITFYRMTASMISLIKTGLTIRNQFLDLTQ